MENASKALIMAAAVLIAILVLSLIVYLYSTFSQAQRDNIELMNNNQLIAFNGKYLAYDGRKDLTYYDIANIATMARKDNEDIEDIKKKIYVLFFKDGGGILHLSRLDRHYNDFISNLNNKDALIGSSSLIMQDGEPTTDLATGEKKDTRVLIKYRCDVIINPETGRVYEIRFNKTSDT